MSMRERRAQARIPVSLKAELNGGDAWRPCRILDVSEKGFLLVCNKSFAPGRQLALRCELYPKKLLECKVEIMHSDEDAFGTKIVDIDAKSTDLFQVFLQERLSANLSQSRPK